MGPDRGTGTVPWWGKDVELEPATFAIFAGVCWLFICGNLPMRMERSMNQRTKEVTTFGFIATLIMIAAVGLGLLIFHFSDTKDLLAQWLQDHT